MAYPTGPGLFAEAAKVQGPEYVFEALHESRAASTGQHMAGEEINPVLRIWLSASLGAFVRSTTPEKLSYKTHPLLQAFMGPDFSACILLQPGYCQSLTATLAYF